MKPLVARLAAYEVFFPLVAVGTLATIGATIAALDGRFAPAGALSALDWHAHEMLFGHFPAAFAGVMATALPRWTGRPALPPIELLGLAGLWIAARLAALLAPLPVVLVLSPAFPAALAFAAGVRIVAARDRRDYGLLALLALFALADALFLTGLASGATGPGLRLGLAAAALVATVMGGRVAPALTRHLGLARDRIVPVATPRPLEATALAATVSALAAWVARPEAGATALLFVAAAFAQALRLATWRGWTTRDRLPFLALHLGYAALPLGLAAQAAGILRADPRLVDFGVHAWGTGVFGLLCAAIMTSVVRRYAGRAMRPSRLADLVVLGLAAAAGLRLAASLAEPTMPLLAASATTWILAYAAVLALLARDRRLPAPAVGDPAPAEPPVVATAASRIV